jgi:hypothetical protein
MGNKIREKGKVIAQHMHLKARIVCEYKGEGNNRKIATSKIFIFQGKGRKKVGDTESGYKTREDAVKAMKEIYEEQQKSK